jgi:predicted Zn-ribbon and HTH transcriptional regulator
MKKTCLHCGYQWTPRIETEPKACPRCKSPRWNEAPRKGGRPKINENKEAVN